MSLEFDSVSLRLGQTPILHDINLRVAAGEQLALIGPSGAGKTSLLQLANTCLRPSRGHVALLGQDPWQASRRALRALRARIGTVYQAAPLPDRLRVVHAVAAGRLGQMNTLTALARLLWPQDGAAIAAVLEQVALADKLWARCDTLSGGQRQRVGVARVLYQNAALLLADEPVSALDPHLAGETVNLLTRHAAARDAGLIMSLHSVELALAHFPRIVGLREGRILFDLPAAAVTQERLAELYRGETAANTPLPPPRPRTGTPFAC